MKRAATLFVFLLVCGPMRGEVKPESRATDLPPGRAVQRTVLRFFPNGEQNLLPGSAISLPAEFQVYPFSVRRTLRVTGGVNLPPGFLRNENSYGSLYSRIDDALEAARVTGKGMSLAFRGAEDFDRCAWWRIEQSELQPGSMAEFRAQVTAERLAYSENGGAEVLFQFYQKKAGRRSEDIFDKPDAVVTLAIPAGSYEGKEISKYTRIPQAIACILVEIRAGRFEGAFRLEAPELSQAGRGSPIPPFAKFQKPGKNWIGKNLSRKEWPHFAVQVEGKEVFSEEVFDRAAATSDFEVPLPDGAAGAHQIEIELADDYPSALSYAVRSIELIEESARDLEVLAWPEFVRENQRFSVLVQTRRAKQEVRCAGSPNVRMERKRVILAEAGLHVLSFRAGPPCVRQELVISSGDRIVRVQAPQVLSGEGDGVLVGSSDDVFIPKEARAFESYLEWFWGNRLGNALTFRPNYQWDGTRDRREEFWKRYVPLVNEGGFKYALLVDGRTLPGLGINPRDEWLKGQGYLGRQAHENDGNFYYWCPYRYAGLISDLKARSADPGGICAKFRPPRGTEHGENRPARDMEDAATRFVRNLKQAKGPSTRHTGPSTLFRYFFQAGYDWLGAEQMYGPEEITLSSLRGACRAYGKTEYGAHLATQWSSSPYEAPEHSLRLFLSQAVSYLHGATHINTEDGLWAMGNGPKTPDDTSKRYYDRFDETGRAHVRAQQGFFRFVQTHRRRGRLVAPIAVLQGRNDGWSCFARGKNLWAQEGEEWKFGPAEESFDLLNVFYPRCFEGAIYRFPCPNRPQGWYSGTPYGPVDLLPVEAPLEVLNSYPALAFLGWNSYREEDFAKLAAYVKHGGKLLLGRRHLSVELRHDQPSRLPDLHLLQKMLGEGFENRTAPFHRRFGNGEIVYFPQDKYPAEAEVKSDYRKELEEMGEAAVQAQRSRGWIRAAPDVEFAAWDWEDGKHRTIYLLNIDWWSTTNTHTALLLVGDREYPIECRCGKIETITICDGRCAVQCVSGLIDVRRLTSENGNVQFEIEAAEPGEINVYDERSARPISAGISSAGVYSGERRFR